MLVYVGYFPPDRHHVRKARARLPRRPSPSRLSSVLSTALRVLRRSVPKSRIADAVVRGPQAVVGLYPIHAWAEELRVQLAEELARVALDAAYDEAKRMGVKIQKAFRTKLRFDLVNPLATEFALDHAGALVVQIANDVRESIANLVARSVQEGITVDRVADTLYDSGEIGLLPQHQAAVDRQLRASLDAGTPQEQAQAVADRYAERLLDYRMQNIARTELIATNTAGRHGLWDVARDEGLIARDSRKVWVVTPDDRLAVVGSRTKILTRDGWRCVSAIDVGDWVLTHRDRFCQITGVERKWYEGPTVKMLVGCKAVRGVHVTYGHPILVHRDGADMWVLAETVRSTDSLYVNGIRCVDCGVIVPAGAHYPTSNQARCHACNVRVQNTSPRMRARQRKAVREFNAKKWAIPGAREKAAERWRGEKNPVREALRARGRKNYGMSWPERKITWWLRQQGIAFEPQWMFRYGPKQSRGFADFYLPGPHMVIECDGPTHLDPIVAERDRQKDEYLSSQGIRVLRFTDKQIREDVNVLAQPVRAACCIMRHPIKRISHRTLRHNPVYNLTVADDHSFIAGGVVVHNCPFCEDMDGQEVELGQPFTSKEFGDVDGPPLHCSCRCASSLVAEPIPNVGVSDQPAAAEEIDVAP